MKVNSQQISLARLNRGLSINTVIAKLNVSRATIYRLENGISKNPRAETIKKLADLYGEDVSFFMKQVPTDVFEEIITEIETKKNRTTNDENII